MNNDINNFQKFYQKKNILNSCITLEDINIIEEVNNTFILNFINKISDLIDINIKLSSYSIINESDFHNIKFFKSLMYFNLIEVLPCKSQLYVVFPSNMLFFITDILFGGKKKNIFYSNRNTDITSSEVCINQKIIHFFIKSYSISWKKYFLINMNFINIQKNIDFKKNISIFHNKYIVHEFVLNFQHVYFNFYLFTPISILKKNSIMKSFLIRNKNKSLKQISYPISIEQINHVKLNVIVQLRDFFVTEKEIINLSVGDILDIKNPNKVIACLENIPVLLGHYTLFYEQSCFIIKDFININ